MSTIDQTGKEVLESVTGFEEIAIVKAFGLTVEALSSDKSRRLTFARSMVFIVFKRQGKKDAEAKDAALALTIKQVNEFFVPEPDDVDEDDADSDAGKDESSPEEQQEDSPPGA